jgi:hypothetical protein
MIKYFVLQFFFMLIFILCQEIQTPLQKNNFTNLTSYDEMVQYIKDIDSKSDLIKSEVFAKSIEGRELYVLYFSKNVFGEDPNKIKVLIFAQQHGNEQSGKEGALLLIQELLKPENQYLFDKIDFALVPQMNPDGSEKNQRRNGNGMDLNRNHLILTEPETIGLHKLFNKYHFEVTMDVHEYWPFGEDSKKFGYRKNFDETIGTNTNINVSEKIRDLAFNQYIPFLFDFLRKQNITVFHYLPGGPPDVELIRYSTFDINDGRQSFGIQHTFSFIQEGMNGENYDTDNIKHRTKGQMLGMMGLLKFSYDNLAEIKKLVAEEREKLISNDISKKVSIQMDHFADGEKLQLPMFSYYSGKDTVITVTDFRPVIKSLYNVERPVGYLIPDSLTELKAWADNQNIKFYDEINETYNSIEQYFVTDIDSINFEGDMTVNPGLMKTDVTNSIKLSDYFFIPVNQLQNNMIVIAFEPKSELGIVTYKKYEYLLKKGETFSILRVVD